MKKLLVLILSLLFVAGSSYALETSVGSAGAQFLKIGVGSKYQGMGEASVAVANDVYSMYWNPAGLAEIENTQISFTNVNWLTDVDLNYIAYAKNFEDFGVVGISATVLSMGEIEITDFNNRDGTGQFYTSSSYSIGVTYAKHLTNRFSFGGTMKYVGERIHELKSQSIAFDFGTMLHIGYRSLRMGMSISNMGPDLKFSGSDLDVSFNNSGAQLKTTPYSLPLLFRFGMAYDFQMNETTTMTLSGELKHPNDNIRQGALGTEFSFSDKFFLRGGYKFNYEEEGLSFGGGLFSSLSGDTKIEFDYAWQDFGRLTSTQRFSVGFTF